MEVTFERNSWTQQKQTGTAGTYSILTTDHPPEDKGFKILPVFLFGFAPIQNKTGKDSLGNTVLVLHIKKL
jgi:hypothetical protein